MRRSANRRIDADGTNHRRLTGNDGVQRRKPVALIKYGSIARAAAHSEAVAPDERREVPDKSRRPGNRSCAGQSVGQSN
ncbi:hypothetical protein ACVBGC_26250 [Burkholderia stagnalis]